MGRSVLRMARNMNIPKPLFTCSSSGCLNYVDPPPVSRAAPHTETSSRKRGSGPRAKAACGNCQSRSCTWPKTESPHHMLRGTLGIHSFTLIHCICTSLSRFVFRRRDVPPSAPGPMCGSDDHDQLGISAAWSSLQDLARGADESSPIFVLQLGHSSGLQHGRAFY